MAILATNSNRNDNNNNNNNGDAISFANEQTDLFISVSKVPLHNRMNGLLSILIGLADSIFVIRWPIETWKSKQTQRGDR